MTPVGSLVEASYHLRNSRGSVWFHHHGMCLCVGLRRVCFIKPCAPVRHWCRLLVDDLTYADKNGLTCNGKVPRVCGQTKRIFLLFANNWY